MTARPPSRSGALEAIDRILNRGGEADDVLRQVVGVLHGRAGYAWACIGFVRGEAVLPGPDAGEPDEAHRTVIPVVSGGTRVAELAVDGAGDDDRPFLERVALLVSAHCRAGREAGGAAWTGG